MEWKDLLYPYEQAVSELTVKFETMIREYQTLGLYSPISSVAGRVKQVSSILDKAARKGIAPDRIEAEVEDIAGIRILCPFVEDIYKVRALIRQRNNIDMTILEERDYIENVKPSGYRSYHIIILYPLNTILGYREVQAELQIRTLAMDFWATAEHSLRYKYKGKMPEELTERLRLCAEASRRLDEEMGTIREELMYAQHLNEMGNDTATSIADHLEIAGQSDGNGAMEGWKTEFQHIMGNGDLSELKAFSEQLETGKKRRAQL